MWLGFSDSTAQGPARTATALTHLPPPDTLPRMQVTAEQLLALMQAGDMGALDALARTCGPRLLAVARRRCHRPGDAEDAVQQALLAASTGMRQFRGDSTALAWLSTLVARSCSRFNERHAREGHALPDGDEPCCAACGDDGVADAVGVALMQVSRTDRLAFLLSVEGFSSVEIAQRFGLSHDAVRSRLKRVRKVVRAVLVDGAGATRG